MIDYAKFAHPYAKAVFEYAKDQDQLDKWSVTLHAMAQRLSQPDVIQLLKNPKLSVEQKVEICIAVGTDVLDQAGKNLIRELAVHNRLNIFPALATLYEQFRAEAERRISVNVTSAIPLSEAYIQRLKETLSQRFHRQAELQCEVAPAILGGLIISAEGRVIDNSVRGQLQRLREQVIN